MTDKRRPAWAVRLEAERSARGWGKHEMARRLLAASHIERGSIRNLARQIHRWEAGEVFPRDWATAYATVFKVPKEDLFGPECRPPEGQSTTPTGTVEKETRPDNGDDDVKRRALLELMAALGAGAAVPAGTVAAVLAALESSLDAPATELDAPGWQNLAWEYSQEIWVQPVGALMRDLAADIMDLGVALQREKNPSARRDLLRVSAQLTTYMSQELSDLGRYRDAGRALQAATRAADESGDRELSVWVRCYRASNAFWENRPPQVVRSFLDDALEHASETPSSALARVFDIRAKFLAAQGDTAGAEKALQNLRETFSHLPDHITQDHISPLGFPESSLRQAEGFTHVMLGNAKRAIPTLEQAITLTVKERSGTRTNLNLLLALALVHDRDITEGLNHAATTLNGMPTSSSRRRITEEIIKALPDEKTRALPAARELRALAAGKT